MTAPLLQAVLSLAALGNGMVCCYAVGERMQDGTYVIHRGDVPRELKAKHLRVDVEDSVKARLMVAGDRALLRMSAGTWTVEARE